LDFDGLGDDQRILKLNAEVSCRAVHPGPLHQKLNCPLVGRQCKVLAVVRAFCAHGDPAKDHTRAHPSKPSQSCFCSSASVMEHTFIWCRRAFRPECERILMIKNESKALKS
jgi:hypothetical protein